MTLKVFNSNPPLPVPIVRNNATKRCRPMPAKLFMNVRAARQCYDLMREIAVSFVRLAQCHARQFNKHARKEMVQHPAVNPDIRVGSRLCENTTFSKIHISDIFGKAADNAPIIEAG